MSAEEKIVIRLYAEKDADLLDWLAAIPNEHGAKSVMVKSALRKGLASGERHDTGAAHFDAEALLDALLPPLRRLVESAIQSEIARLRLSPLEDHDQGASDQEDISRKLDALGADLMR